MSLHDEPITTRFVSGVTFTLAMPFSLSSMSHTVSVPSALRPRVLVELPETCVLVPEPNLGFSPKKTSTVLEHSERISTMVGTLGFAASGAFAGAPGLPSVPFGAAAFGSGAASVSDAEPGWAGGGLRELEARAVTEGEREDRGDERRELHARTYGPQRRSFPQGQVS